MKTVHALSIAILLMSGVAAILGGGSMLIDPSGQGLGLPTDMLNNTPFVNYFIPGLVLFVGIGALGIITGILTVLKNRYSARLTILQGAILTSWIGVQAVMLQTLNPLQILFGSIGFTLFCLGLFQAEEDAAIQKNDFAD